MAAMPGERREKVVVAMSGGVDSSVAACLLHEAGYDVTGLFMRVGAEAAIEGDACMSGGCATSDSGGFRRRTAARAEVCGSGGMALPVRAHRGCCSASDAGDARFVAGMLGIGFYALNFKGEFDRIIDYFADEYVRGRTPNPCVVCNNDLKFGKIVEYADAIGARHIATGHYARIGERGGRRALMRGRDDDKDQSYVLFGIDRDVLDRAMFPIGEYTKGRVRELAARFKLPNRDKPDSVEICFVPDRDYARVVRHRRPGTFVEGDVVDGDGRVMGRHRGIGGFTIGQRRGLGIAAGAPIYVTRIDEAANTITVGPREALLRSGLIAERASFLLDPPGEVFRARVQIRYLHTAAAATVRLLEGDGFHVAFDEGQPAITPGQAAVLYDGEAVLGGGWIARSCDADDIEGEAVSASPALTIDCVERLEVSG
jgi:tRNA-specific 2-thiouridylase